MFPGLSTAPFPKEGGADTQNSLLPRTLFALFIFHSPKGALVGSLQLAHARSPSVSIHNLKLIPCIPRVRVGNLFSFLFKEHLRLLLSQTNSHHTDVPWAIITGSWCVPKRTKGRVVLLTVKKMFQEAPAILKDCNLKQMIEKERELLHSSWKEILPRAGMD